MPSALACLLSAATCCGVKSRLYRPTAAVRVCGSIDVSVLCNVSARSGAAELSSNDGKRFRASGRISLEDFLRGRFIRLAFIEWK